MPIRPENRKRYPRRLALIEYAKTLGAYPLFEPAAAVAP